jgi:hypothetical protein
MRRRGALLAFALSTVACSSLPWAARDVEGEVQQLYDEIARGIEERDVDRVSRFSLADASVEFADGTTLRLAQWKESARASWANITQAKASIVVDDVQERDAGADVTYTETHDILVVDPKTEQEHRIEYDGRWFASLRRNADGWRIVHSRELRRAVKVDGSLIDDTQSKH